MRGHKDAGARCLSLTDLLDGGGELQAQLDDSALGGGEVVGARWGPRGEEVGFISEQNY